MWGSEGPPVAYSVPTKATPPTLTLPPQRMPRQVDTVDSYDNIRILHLRFIILHDSLFVLKLLLVLLVVLSNSTE